jgi:hypothetical protein
MLPAVLRRLLGEDLDHKFAELRAKVEEFRARATHQVTEQIKETGLVVGLALVGAAAASATFIIALVALYLWVDMRRGPFAALTAVGLVTALLAAVMFTLAFGRGKRKQALAPMHQRPAAAPPPPAPPPPAPVSLPAPPSSLPPNASVLDVLTHRFSTRVAAASDEAVDAAVNIMRTGSRSALFGTLAAVALVGVLLGRRR